MFQSQLKHHHPIQEVAQFLFKKFNVFPAVLPVGSRACFHFSIGIKIINSFLISSHALGMEGHVWEMSY